jgi:hypothetical protein
LNQYLANNFLNYEAHKKRSLVESKTEFFLQIHLGSSSSPLDNFCGSAVYLCLAIADQSKIDLDRDFVAYPPLYTFDKKEQVSVLFESFEFFIEAKSGAQARTQIAPRIILQRIRILSRREKPNGAKQYAGLLKVHYNYSYSEQVRDSSEVPFTH